MIMHNNTSMALGGKCIGPELTGSQHWLRL